MATFEQDIATIRTAAFTTDVREAIADGLLKCPDMIDEASSERSQDISVAAIPDQSGYYMLNFTSKT